MFITVKRFNYLFWSLDMSRLGGSLVNSQNSPSTFFFSPKKKKKKSVNLFHLVTWLLNWPTCLNGQLIYHVQPF